MSDRMYESPLAQRDAAPDLPRTPKPSSFQQGLTLMKRNARNDMRTTKGRLLWMVRTLAVAGFLILYTIGFASNYPSSDDDDLLSGGFRFFEGKNWDFSTIYLAGQSDTLVMSVADSLLEQNIEVETEADATNATFPELCEDFVGGASIGSKQCVFLSSSSEYRIIYGGGESTAPYADEIAATQYAINTALLTANGDTNQYPVTQIQSIPEIEEEKDIEDLQTEPLALGISLPMGALTGLAMVVMSSFLISPMVKEKKQEVVNAFVRVGVPHRVYMFQWMIYLSLNSLLTAAALTAATVGFQLYPMSSAGLVYVSHYLTLVHFNGLWTIVSQIVDQEELSQGIPFILFVLSCIYGFPIIIFMWGQITLMVALLSIGGIISPFLSVLNYTAMYIRFDVYGVDTGIHADEFIDSKLWMSYLSSAIGILLNLVIIWNFSSIKSAIQRSPNHDESGGADSAEDGSRGIEPLPSHAEVLVRIRGLFHTFTAGFGCKKAEPVEVLKGLDLDICRGEVLGYLGANGAGKSTTISILSGEVKLQKEKSISFNFSDGHVDMDTDPNTLDLIRRHIGVCPQHNNLIGDDTCRETLRLFATLKGHLPMAAGQTVEDAIEVEVARRLDDLKFTSDTDADKPVETYSGGMKRKVMIAISMIGDPEILYLDEPTAGLDPYNRRVVWDLIIEAKVGRSIILCSHHLEEVDVLSDRVAILKEGKTVACGSGLFLKHFFGAGYTLGFDTPDGQIVDDIIRGVISDAEEKNDPKPNHFTYSLKHGSEPQFPDLLKQLGSSGVSNVVLELTTLEQVFLKTIGDESTNEESEDAAYEEDAALLDIAAEDEETRETQHEKLCRIWQTRGTVIPLTTMRKLSLVSNFMMANAWKMKESISINIAFPLLYCVAGFVAVKLIGEPEGITRIFPEAFRLPVETDAARFFGVSDDGASLSPTITSVDEYAETSDYFDGEPTLGGFWSRNGTLQYNGDVSPFALQIGLQILSNISSSGVLTTELLQLPYDTAESFRSDLLLLPMAVVFGFTGMVLTVLDVLTLKADNIVDLFRVAGINEWTTYLGIMRYKSITTFVPFFLLVVILGLALGNVLFGNAGRWLASLITMLSYLYSATPLGLILGKRFIKSNYDSAKSWLPGVYLSLVTLPYVAWSIALQSAPDSRDLILIIGDFMCLIPPVAFQRSLGAVIEVSSKADDPDLGWDDVYKFETRVILSIVLMNIVGTLEWMYLYRLTTLRPQQTPHEDYEVEPIEITDEDVAEERQKSLQSNAGINARDVVKVFKIPPEAGRGGSDILKKAVKGVSLGVKKNEVSVLLGPNGAGKTTLMSAISGSLTPEHGSLVLDGRQVAQEDPSTDHMFERCNVSWCPQHDSLFPSLTVEQHLKFYAEIRGLNWKDETTTEHIDAIADLLGLKSHLKKASNDLSGGYKRRLSLAIAFIGYPSLMCVDECTTGVDPSARHAIWATLQPDYLKEDYALPATLLSTHYMDEASTLGTKIGIMIDGELVTIGTLDRLRERYCNSYFVEISLQQDSPEGTEANIIRRFHDKGMESSVYESIPLHLKLQIPFKDGSESSIDQLAEIFKIMEAHKNQLSVKYYSVAQMDLEQIFIDLSRKQFEVEESTRIM